MHSASTNPRKFACKVLQNIFRGEAITDDVFEAESKDFDLSELDRALAFELVYGVLRLAITLDWRLDQLSRKPMARLPLNVATVLRVATYQLLYLDRIPDSAAVNEAVKLIRKQPGHDWGGLVNGILRNLIRQPAPIFPDMATDPVQAISIRYSCPVWMVTRWMKAFGPGPTEALCCKTLDIPPMTLRCNSLRGTRKALFDRLEAEGLSTNETRVAPLGIILEKSGNPNQLSALQEGWCYIEDEAAQLIPPLLDPQPGERILDACAAPGGKTTHLAQLMQNKGTIIAVDRRYDRLMRLEENCHRLGITMVQMYEHDATTEWTNIPSKAKNVPLATPGSPTTPFDRILIDAPCSGLGILRRHPEGKIWKQVSTITQSRRTQEQILDQVCSLLRPGGIIVYSACSIEPEETTEVVSAFCQEHPDFQLEPVTPWVPVAGHSLVTEQGHLCTGFQSFTMDGFFACRLKKTEML